MPWCEPCSRFLTPTSLREDGGCPTCGTRLAEGRAPAKIPWHFWLLVGALGIYLGWRVIQGAAWFAGLF
jgi:hypothetical protein